MGWRLPTLPPVTAVPLALRGLTALFGMGRGEHPRYNHHYCSAAYGLSSVPALTGKIFLDSLIDNKEEERTLELIKHGFKKAYG